jgi:hypothetical protein
LWVASCVGAISDPGATGHPDDPTQTPAGFEPIPVAMQRLTVAQYHNSIVDVLGQGLTLPDDPEPDTTLNGFVSIGASRTSISGRGVEKYEEAAYALAAEALAPGRRAAIVQCTPTSTTDAVCADAFIRSIGRQLFRRPLTDEEAARYLAVATNAARTLGDFYAGLEFALAGLLQSPNFLFRVELGEPTPSDAGTLRYGEYEMASRLSYVLWNSTPDEELLAAAERGELTTDAGLAAQVDRLLASDRSREALRNFFSELLVLDDLETVEKNTAVFPELTESLRASSREETLAVLEHYTTTLDTDYREVFSSDITFVNGELASLYGLSATGGTALSEVTLPPERRGLLGHASLMTIHSHDEKTSATLRGRFVRQVLLCGNIPAPPPGVSTILPPSSAPTLRDRVAVHLMNVGCASCHERMDPIGLGLENFDAIGRFRATENDATIDPSGVLDGVSFADAAELGAAIGNHPDLGPCLTRSLFRYAVGDTETAGQESELAALFETFDSEGHRVRALLRALMLSPGFRLAGEPR